MAKRAPTLPTLETDVDPLELKVRTVIADQLGLDVERVQPDAAIMQELGADSLDVVELCMDIEQEFGLPEIDEDTVEGFVRVRNVVDYVRKARQ